MKILVIGEESHFAECRKKFGQSHEYIPIGSHHEAEKFLGNQPVIFDFIIDEEPHEFDVYADKSLVVFLNTCKITLSELIHTTDFHTQCTFIGFNGMPSLFDRSLLEVAVTRSGDVEVVKNICRQLNTEYRVVEDRVGLVTPRVLCMIINEAYYTLQEGTASRQDIDVAMKLGTNYPYGPFEWCKRIGIRDVYELLEAVYEDTKDERYKICPLLKKEYLSS